MKMPMTETQLLVFSLFTLVFSIVTLIVTSISYKTVKKLLRKAEELETTEEE